MSKDMARETNKLIRFMCVVFLMVSSFTYVVARHQNTNISFPPSLELENKLNQLNKRPVKSIMSPDGDIIDCINIYEQPAFDHPLLKNHTIQLKPSVSPNDFLGSINKSFTNKQPWRMNGSCPPGSIPIRKTKIDDLLRAESTESFGTEKRSSIHRSKAAKYNAGHEYAIAYLHGNGAKYHGASGTLNVWNPIVENENELSLAQIWVVAGPSDGSGGTNTVEAGWQVHPRLYGDKNTRLFIFWTSDGYKSKKCYNLNCPGFVHVSESVVIGGTLPASTYGEEQHEIKISIFKDAKTGNWWLQLGDKVIGYWPASLFTYLRDGATSIEWGGEVVNVLENGEHTTTHMGSGHFSNEGYRRASYIKDMKYIEEPNIPRNPTGFEIYVDNSKCYDIQIFDNENHIYFGGPGRSPTCP